MSTGQWFASETGGQGIWALSESAAGGPTYTLTLDNGTVTVSGSAALRDMSMVLGHGTVSVSGQSVTFASANYTLVLEHGTVRVSGQMIQLPGETASVENVTLRSISYSTHRRM